MTNFIKTTNNSIKFNYWCIEEDDDNKKLLFKNRDTPTGDSNYSTVVEITSSGITGDNINNISSNGSSTIIDYTNLNPSSIKINTNTDTLQEVKGIIEKYTLTGTTGCYVGQPLMFGYDDTNGNISAKEIKSINSINELIGISLNQCNVNESVSILRNGYCTARFKYDNTNDTNYTSIVKLETDYKNSTPISFTGDNILFTDSGGLENDYSSNEDYVIIFDAGSGSTIGWTINSLSFEPSSSFLYDYLKYEFSNDNTTYSNIYQNGFIVSSTSETSGNVFPNGTSIITNNGGTLNYSSEYRYVKFTFKSDGSVTQPGWSIIIKSTSNSPNVSINTPLYLDNTDKTKVTNNSTTNLLVGYSMYTDANNDSIFMKINTI